MNFAVCVGCGVVCGLVGLAKRFFFRDFGIEFWSDFWSSPVKEAWNLSSRIEKRNGDIELKPCVIRIRS